MRLGEYLNLEGLSQKDFGKLVGVSRSHINQIVRGRKNPSLELAKIIGEITFGKVNIVDLLNHLAPSRLKKRKNK